MRPILGYVVERCQDGVVRPLVFPEATLSKAAFSVQVQVSDWLVGVNVARQHPFVWRHWQVCKDCRTEFESLADLLLPEEGSIRPDWLRTGYAEV